MTKQKVLEKVLLLKVGCLFLLQVISHLSKKLVKIILNWKQRKRYETVDDRILAQSL